MSAIVFPPRNLGGSADKWGRAVEAQLKVSESAQEGQIQKTDNALRALGGQLAVSATQLEELANQQEILRTQQQDLTSTVSDLTARSTHSTSPANLSLIQGSSSGQSGPATRVVSFPGPASGRRNAIIVGSGSVAWTGTSTGTGIQESVSVGIEFRQGSTRIWYDNASAGSSRMFTFIGSDTFNLVVPVQVPAGGSTFDLRMWVGASSSGGQAQRGARLEGMNFSIIYGDTY